MSQKQTSTRRVLPRLEELESRHLPSVVVTPPVLNLKTASQGNGVFTVRVLGDDAAAQALLSSGATLVFQVTDASGKTVTLAKPLSVRERNGGGIAAEVLKFRRSVLRGLSAGLATITVSLPTSTTKGTTTGPTTGSTPSSETGTFLLFTPGGKDRPGHQGSGDATGGQQPHGHGKHG
jgi:hypothetical protein